jgi:ABC-type transporter Mla subunit MlaD
MARRQHSELAAGAFVVAALAVLIGVVVWMGAADIFRPAKQRAVFYLNESDGSAGLGVGSAVNINGQQIGKVDSVELDTSAGRTYFNVQIANGSVTVHSDGVASPSTDLIGGKSLEILNRGSEDAPPADKEHAVRITGGMNKAMSDLALAVETLSRTVQAELSTSDPEALLAKVHAIVNGLSLAAANVGKVTANILAQTDAGNDQAALCKINKFLGDLTAMTDDARPKVAESLENVRQVSATVKGYVDNDVADVLARLRESNDHILKITRDLSTVSGTVRQLVVLHRDNIDEFVDNMVAVSANLKATASDLRRNPWRLLHKPSEGELNTDNIRSAAVAFSNGAEQLDQAISKLNMLAKESPEGVPADDPALVSVREHLVKTFDNFSHAEDALWQELKKSQTP